MQNAISVRQIRTEDHAAWKALWDGYNAFYGRSGETALPEEITRVTWSRFFDGYEPVNCLVAERDGKVVGLAHYIFHRSTIAIGPTCYLQDLYTEASVRGAGVGRALILAVYEKAAQAGSGRVYWLTHDTNESAMKLYDKVAEKSGFVQYRKAIP
jgi:GNAT superfamily N-acetyltransferase